MVRGPTFAGIQMNEHTTMKTAAKKQKASTDQQQTSPRSGGNQTTFIDSRPESAWHARMQHLADGAPQPHMMIQAQQLADSHSERQVPLGGETIQRKEVKVLKGSPPGSSAWVLLRTDDTHDIYDDGEAPVLDQEVPDASEQVIVVPIKEGVFSGTFERGPNRNWADLHVTGAINGKAEPGALLMYFRTVYNLMLAHYQSDNVPGILEWHPTGAVVTKQIVELLGESLGSWWHWMRANNEQRKRRNNDRLENRQRNNLAGKISPEFIPEHLHYLKSLKNKEGLYIGVRGLPIPDDIREYLQSEEGQQLSAEEIEMLLSPDITSDSEPGKASLAMYEQALHNPEMEEGPSLVIKLSFTHLPKLIDKLERA